MPRKPEPSWEMKKQIIGFAAKEGQDNLSVIQRDIDKVIWKERSPKRESTPDIRTIKRIIKEFQMLDREIVMREFPRYVWKMRDDFEEIKARQETEDRIHVEPKEFLSLLSRWREQAQFWWPDEFLRQYYLVGLSRELQRRGTEPACDAATYITAKKHHAKISPTDGMAPLAVEHEGLFHWLRRCYPNDAIWEVQHSWGLARAAYFEAFASWCGDTEYLFQGFVALASMDESQQHAPAVDAIGDFLQGRKMQDADWLVFLVLASVVFSCDLLTLGLAELPADVLWFLQVDKLQMLKAEVVNTGTKLPGDFWVPQNLDCLGKLAGMTWERLSNAESKRNTRDLLDKLQTLQAAHDDLHSKLEALECRLYGVTESQPP